MKDRSTREGFGSIRGVCRPLVLAGLIAAASSQAGMAAENDLVAALTGLSPAPSGAALAQITDSGRKLLALRSYLRAGSRLADRWSWTDEQIAAFEGSAEQKALLGEMAAVGAHFSACNPGYTLYVHSTVRSLDVQIEHWNANDSVGAAAGELAAAYAGAFAGGKAGADAIRKWLVAYKGQKQSNIAAPGLSPHGRARAIDFQVMKGGKIVAGADSHQIDTVWRAEHWDARLLASMNAAGPSFFGPLKSPDEPWHFDYDPARRAADRTGPKAAPGAPIDCGSEDAAPPAPK